MNSSGQPIGVLIVEDDENSAELLVTFVQSEGYTALVANSLEDARQQLILHRPRVVLLDLLLPDGSGMDLFADEELRGDAEIVLITGNASVETSVEALRLGAADYLIKPVSLKLLSRILARLTGTAGPSPAASVATTPPGPSRTDSPEAVMPSLAAIGAGSDRGAAVTGTSPSVAARRARGTARPADAGPEAAHAVAMTAGFHGMVGQSAPMQDVYAQITRVARTSVSVFVVGESGTGKELVAQSVHESSRRKDGPFEGVNCGAISSQLIESELFGHEKGSFTGAIRQHRGFFERAGGGTLFLDEITEMSLDLQVKLLRVLETGTFSRVGSDSLLRSDVRIVAATNRDPFDAIGQGKLREDLFYRLNVFQIQLPPLRARPDDVPLLAQHFLNLYASKEGRELRFDASAAKALKQHRWPGNVRELRNYVHRAAIMSDGPVITAATLPPHDGTGGGSMAVQADGTAPADRAIRPAPSEVGAASGSAVDSAHAVTPLLVSVDRRSSAVNGEETHAEIRQADEMAVDVPDDGGIGDEASVESDASVPSVTVRVGTSIAEMERELILATLQYAGGAKEKTAELLGISLKTLYNRLRSYDTSE